MKKIPSVSTTAEIAALAPPAEPDAPRTVRVFNTHVATVGGIPAHSEGLVAPEVVARWPWALRVIP